MTETTDSAVEWLKPVLQNILISHGFFSYPSSVPILLSSRTGGIFKLYPLKDISLPHPFEPKKHTDHPYLRDIRDFLGLNEGFKEEEILRSIAAYYGQCSYLDSNLGRIFKCFGRKMD